MFAIVESGSITSMPRGNKGVEINGIKHPASIFTLWSESERNAIGVYTVEIDETNKKDQEWYLNTNITYSFSGGKVKGTYGTATGRAIADTLYTETDKSNGDIPTGKDVGDVRDEGLKTIKKRMIDNQCAGILKDSDWMVVKATETGGTMNSAWKTWRASVRTKCNSMQTQIDNAADTAALQALFTYTTTDGVTSRPLGEFPVKE
tara:strand:- start:220 stop:834 length:615 start_codon:yes stop_codon:yes gene_type:complete